MLLKPDQTFDLLSLALAPVDGNAPAWVQLVPKSVGEVVANDGRKWNFANPDAVIAASMGKSGKFAIDYNHGTDLAAKEGHDVRAAGWVVEMRVGGPEGEPGLWGRVDWTPAGGRAVADKEYCFLSPVIISSKANGHVVRIERAALTNDPALEVKGLFHTTTENDEVIKLPAALLAALGLAETADEATAVTTAKSLLARSNHLDTIVKSGGLKLDSLNDDQVTGLCAKIKAPANGDAATVASLQTKVDTLTKDLLALEAKGAQTDATSKVDQAIKDGKVTPATRDWAIDYCSRDPKGFDEFVSKTPTILANGKLAPEAAKDGELTAEQKEICSQLGMTEDAFKKELAARKKENV